MSVSEDETGKPLLLVVEDDPDYREVLRLILGTVPTATEYRIEIKACCDEAFEHLRTETPRVLVSDFNLPNHTGVEVCQAAAEADASCLRVILTGLPEHVPADAIGDDLAAQAVWEKSLDPTDLVERFDGLLRRGLGVPG